MNPKYRLKRDLVALSGLGLLVVLTTSFYGLVSPLTPGKRELPSAELQGRTALWRAARSTLEALAPSHPRVATVAAIVSTATAFLAYSAAVALLWRRPPSRRLLAVVVAVAVLLLLAGLVALPNSSSDIYDYLLTARVRTAHHANPLLVAPDNFSGDALWRYASRQYTAHPDNKLGVWVAFTLLPAKLAGDDPVRSLLLLRAALAVAGVVNVLLLAMAWATALGAASMLVKVLSAPFLLILLVGQVRNAAVPFRALATRLLLGVAVVLGTYQLFGRDPLLVVRHLQAANSPGWSVGTVSLVIAVLGFATVASWAMLQQDGTLPTYLRSATPLALYAAAVLGYIGFAWYLMAPLSINAIDNMTTGGFRPVPVTQLLSMPLVIALVLGAFAVLALVIVRRRPNGT